MSWTDQGETNIETSYKGNELIQLQNQLQASKARENENARKLTFLQVHCHQLVEKVEKMRTKCRDLEEELIKAALVVYQMEQHIQSQQQNQQGSDRYLHQ